MKLLAFLLSSIVLVACGGGKEPVASPSVPVIKATAPAPVKKATTVAGGNGVVIHMYQALYGMAPSNALLLDYAFQANNDASTFVKSLTDRFASTSHADLAKLVLDNLGVTGTAVPAVNANGQSEYALLLDAVNQLFAAYPTMRGQVILNMANLLAGLESDATYGAAAVAYDGQARSNLAYSSDTANIETKVSTSQEVACSVQRNNYGDIPIPNAYLGTFPIPVPTQTLPPLVIRAIGVKDYYPGYLPKTSACQDRVLHARNLYRETLNRLQEDGVQQTFLYNYGPWEDFGKAIWSVSPNDYQIPPSEVAFFVNEANIRNIKVVLAWQFTAVDIKGMPLPMGGTKTPAELKQMLASFHPLIVEQARVGQQIGLGGIYADWHAFWVSNLSSDPVLREIWIVEMMSIIADIKKVFSGKILYGANTAVIDPRIAAEIDQFTLSLAVPYQSISASENGNLSVAMVKAAYLSSIQQAKAEYDSQMAGSSISIPINWAVSPQSKYNYFVEGWTEDGFCVSGCAQLKYMTDYSVQAIGIEAALQAIASQRYFTNGTVDIDSAYWHTDDVGPDNMGWDDYAKINNWDFPNLSQSIRNKPAEAIARWWFKQ